MTSTIETRLTDAGITLPAATAPLASYVPYTIEKDFLFISGQLPLVDGNVVAGILGKDVDEAAGQEAAKLCGIALLAQAKAALSDDLDQLARCLKLTGFVAATPDFTAHPAVINGASDLMALAMGEAGRHARAAVGVSSLPLGACVEVEAIFSLH